MNSLIGVTVHGAVAYRVFPRPVEVNAVADASAGIAVVEYGAPDDRAPLGVAKLDPRAKAGHRAVMHRCAESTVDDDSDGGHVGSHGLLATAAANHVALAVEGGVAVEHQTVGGAGTEVGLQAMVTSDHVAAAAGHSVAALATLGVSGGSAQGKS